MNTIWKFPFSVEDRLEISMPRGAEILDIQVQHGRPCMWALVNPEMAIQVRRFHIFGTGHHIPDELRNKMTYVGTFQIEGGALVFHVFEV